MKRILGLYAVLLFASLSSGFGAEAGPTRRGGTRQPIQSTRWLEVPAHPFDTILTQPTSNSVTVSVLCYVDAEGLIAYGTGRDTLTNTTPKRRFEQGVPAEVLLSGLRPNTQYFYQLRFGRTKSAVLAFQTARPPGSPFTFTISADSHLDENTDPMLYQRTLAYARIDKPDFHIDLGDTFMTEKHASREAAAKQYLAQRYYFGQLCQSAPLFLVLGNHDGESPRGRDTGADSLAVWSNQMRKRYFPNPVPDGFYAGNGTPHPNVGPLQDYYAWEWGDALFVVLDPFWFAFRQRGQNDNWSRTLGSEQYQWLKHALDGSKARFKFVFIHNLVGGQDNQSRGGAGAAPFYEWGGKNADGSDGFALHRPGWAAPIHQLLVQNHVTAVFHGHDHLYAKQDLDGIVYQEVPQPGDPKGSIRSAADYGYVNGTIMGGAGYIRIAVSSAKVAAQYVHADGSVAHSY